MDDYLPRVADAELASLMRAVGAVLVEGPKACGKTATASQVAATIYDMDQDEAARTSLDLNPDYLFQQPTPILFDEWQTTPQLWNRVRRAVDSGGRRRGRYILTGSATPKDDVTRHSGAGRYGVLRMRPMSLFESGHSNGEVSLESLLDGRAQKGRDNGMTVADLMRRIVIGGWPDLLDAEEPEARIWLSGYLQQCVEVDVPSFVGRRDPRTLRRVLSSLARFVAQSPSMRAIAADVGGERGPAVPSTIYNHVDALERLHLLDNSEAWQPRMHSRSRLRKTETRYFVDPSIATAALDVGSADLLGNLDSAGYHFEALAIRDLRIYAQRLGGRVSTWRDEAGNEVDAVITLPGGRWAAVEIKLGPSQADQAAAGLLKFAERVDQEEQGPPQALIVVTGTGAAGRRKDGVDVVPITALAP